MDGGFLSGFVVCRFPKAGEGSDHVWQYLLKTPFIILLKHCLEVVCGWSETISCCCCNVWQYLLKTPFIILLKHCLEGVCGWSETISCVL